tara:strand:+ start:573 stop:1592 length:1020 start_codon:yes stop_codon:yes gene_type:complete
MDKTRRRIEYVWLDGKPNFPQLRSKARYINMDDTYHGLPDWNFDGGSTKQGSVGNSDRCLHPVRAYKDPFHEDGLLVLCEVLYHNKVPHESNLRKSLFDLVEKNPDAGYLAGMEQEFTFINPANLEPLGLLLSPRGQGQYYCGVGCMNVIGRFIVEDFEKKCWEAGVELDGVNAEVMPGQWEFQTSPQGPVKTADDLWMTRYILDRVAETHAAIVSYDPKPHPDMNGAGCHTNISTTKTRECFEVDEWEDLMTHLEIDHPEYIKVCGEGIEQRLTGDCETSDYGTFSWGVGDRGASIRIPEQVSLEKAGYFEDRRPSANIDPYRVLYSLISSVNKSKVL